MDNAEWRVIVVALLLVCALALSAIVVRGCAEDRRRDEARMRAIYRDLGNGDERMGEMRYRVRDQVREIERGEQQ